MLCLILTVLSAAGLGSRQVCRTAPTVPFCGHRHKSLSGSGDSFCFCSIETSCRRAHLLLRLRSFIAGRLSDSTTILIRYPDHVHSVFRTVCHGALVEVLFHTIKASFLFSFLWHAYCFIRCGMVRISRLPIFTVADTVAGGSRRQIRDWQL